MYCKTFRYSVKPEMLEMVLEVSHEIDGRMKDYFENFRKYVLIRESEGKVEVFEIYFFESWEEWRRLMDATLQDSVLEELWEKFERLIMGEVLEEDWEVLGEV